MACRLAVFVIAAMVTSAAFPTSAAAQAWVPAKGEGSVSVLFQDLFVDNHLTASGAKQDRGEIHSMNLLADVNYGLTDRVALTLALPFIRTRYSGAFRHPTDLDDGTPHSGFQDVRFGVRVNVVDGPVTVTPFIGTSVPSHSYEYFAHAAYGPNVTRTRGRHLPRQGGPGRVAAGVRAGEVCLRLSPGDRRRRA